MRPAYARNHLERDFQASEPNTKWMVDIIFIKTSEGRLYLCAVLGLSSHKVVGGSMSPVLNRHMVIKAVMMACWQRPDRSPVILHPDRGTQFTSADYQQFLQDHYIIIIIIIMSAVGHCGDNAAMEGFFGVLKRERVYRHRYLTLSEARSDMFDYTSNASTTRACDARWTRKIRPLDS